MKIMFFNEKLLSVCSCLVRVFTVWGTRSERVLRQRAFIWNLKFKRLAGKKDRCRGSAGSDRSVHLAPARQ